jgi:hypothetical protein
VSVEISDSLKVCAPHPLTIDCDQGAVGTTVVGESNKCTSAPESSTALKECPIACDCSSSIGLGAAVPADKTFKFGTAAPSAGPPSGGRRRGGDPPPTVLMPPAVIPHLRSAGQL